MEHIGGLKNNKVFLVVIIVVLILAGLVYLLTGMGSKNRMYEEILRIASEPSDGRIPTNEETAQIMRISNEPSDGYVPTEEELATIEATASAPAQ